MTDTTTTDVRQLVQEGRAAATAGDNLMARARFRRATELDPAYADAWLGLSSVAPVLEEKRTYLRRVLELEPANADARDGLAYVEKLLAEGYQLAPSRRREERHASGDASPLLSSPPTEAAPAVEFCYRHPERETGLHCTQCNRPICGSCARMTSVGQLCPECRRERRPSNYKVSPVDVIVGGLVALISSAVVAILLGMFLGGFFGIFLIIIAGPMIAEFIVRIVDRVTKLKRGRAMQVTVGVAIALGTLPFAIFNPLLLLYMILAIAAASARLR